MQFSKKLRAFTTGCLVSLTAFGYPSQLLANSFQPQEIDGVTSTFQDVPSSESEIDDAHAAIDAGLNPVDALTPKPMPIREYTSFLSDVWSVLFSSSYNTESSSIHTTAWLDGPTGAITAANEHGESVQIEITLSLEILPGIWSEVDQESLNTIENASARMGIAWTELSNTSGDSLNLLVFWTEWIQDGTTTTLIMPINTVSQEEIDLYAEIIPHMDGFFDHPENYNIENYDPSILGIFSRFRAAVKTAVVAAVATVATAVVTAGVAAVAAATLPAVAVAVAVVVGVAAVATVAAYAYVEIATEQLRDDLADNGFDVSNATSGQVIQLGKIAHELGL